MKITRYLWINDLPKHCDEEEIKKTFQSHGKIQTIRIHGNHKSRGAIVAFIDCKSSTKAYESVKTMQSVPLKLEYCEANGEPGINSLEIPSEYSKNNKDDDTTGSTEDSDSRSRSTSSSSNTSSFGSSLDDCSKYPPIQFSKRLANNKSAEDDLERLSSKSNKSTFANESTVNNNSLNSDYRGLLVENLSQRSSDTSLREGLFHEFKKHGKITSVAVMGQESGRHAIISFKRTEDMEKAFNVSQGKTFFGKQLKIKKHNGYNYIDPDLCPPEHAMDEYHPKATKTLFVGKLATGAIADGDLKKTFKKYGEIIDIDIKIQSNQPDTSFAFVQYYDITSVVRALRNQEAIKVDGKPVKLGFGKSQPSNCIWVGNLQRNSDESSLRRHFKRFGPISLVISDPEYNCTLIQFEEAEDALRAFTDTRERSHSNGNNMARRMQVDYASNEYQMAFMNRLRKSCQFDNQDFLKNIADPYQTEKLQNLLLSYTKYLGLLEESRPRSYDRYDQKSDFDDCDEVYESRRSRPRKSVHQRLYNDSYGIDEDYSDDYHYPRPRPRHYDDHSSSRSPAHRYSRSSHKYIPDQYCAPSSDSRRANYPHYNTDYYDTRPEPPSSSTFYQHRRSPEPAYPRTNRNRSYSPSPCSSVDYYDNYPRYNLSPTRYNRPTKPYRKSRPRQFNLQQSQFDRSPESRHYPKQSRYDFSAIRSKSSSKSPSSKHPQKSIRHELTKKTRSQRSPINKVVATNAKSVDANNFKYKLEEATKPTPIQRTVPSVVQPVDALSKLERERAKLLAELSLLTEDTSSSTATTTNKTIKSVVKIADTESSKPKKKVVVDTSPIVATKKPIILVDTAKVEKILPTEVQPATTKESAVVNLEIEEPSSLSISTQSRDPRLSLSSGNLSPDPGPSTISVVDLPSVPPEISINNNYKDSASDSDLDHTSNLDLDLDKRIRELDAKMNRSEQTIRTLDYSKFRIRKKMNDPSTVSTSSSAIMSPAMSSPVTSSSFLDIGYTSINRDSSSNTSEFIKSMLNQTKSKNYHLLSESVSTAPCSMLPFRTVDLGANDIERRSMFSRFGSSTATSLSFTDTKLNLDPIAVYGSRVPTTTTQSAKVSKISVVASPTTPASTPSTPITPTGIDPNQPMKSILKKSNSITNPSIKPSESPVISKNIANDDLSLSIECPNNQNTKIQSKTVPISDLKRKQRSELDTVESKPQIKRIRNENGPVLDDSLFRTYPSKPMKKPKKPAKKPLEKSPEVMPKNSLAPSSSHLSLSEKTSLKRLERINNESSEKLSKTLSQKKKSDINSLPTKKAKTTFKNGKGKSKSNKIEKPKKVIKRNVKEKMYYDPRDSDDNEEMNGDENSDESDDSDLTENENRESMYDKIKRRKCKANRMNGDSNNKRQSIFEKKWITKPGLDSGTMSSDGLDSDNSDYWNVKTNKRLTNLGKKRARLADVSHMSDSNSGKASLIGKSQSGYKAVSNGTKSPEKTVDHQSPVSSNRLKSVHRPRDWPLKKRPITESSMLSEELPYLEKQSIDEYVVSSPTSMDEEVAQLESIYDETNVSEEVVLDDQHHCETNESPSLTADVNSASQILLTMKSQPNIDSDSSDQQLQSVAEHLISLAQNSNPINDSTISTVKTRSKKPNPQNDQDVTVFVKKIIDRVSQENTHNNERQPRKKPKKSSSPVASVTPTSVIITTSPVSDTMTSVTLSQADDKRCEQSDEAASSTSSTDRRISHTSAKSDGLLQSLDKTIDTVVRSSMSSSGSDTLSIKLVNDIDINFDETKSFLNSTESNNSIKCNLTSLDQTMNDIINKMNVSSPMPIVNSQNSLIINDRDSLKSNMVTPISHEVSKLTNITLNHTKPPVYQLSGNLVLGLPSIVTLNTIVSQQNSMNHIVAFQNSASVPKQLSNQMTVPLNNLSVTNCTSNSTSQILPGLSTTQSTEMVFTKLNPLTSIMIQAPNKPITTNRPVNTSGESFVSIATGVSVCNLSSETSQSNFVTTSLNTHMATPMTVKSLDSNYYLMLQRQNCQLNSKVPNLYQSISNDKNSGAHSIILSQFTNTNSVLSPITPVYLTTPINRSNISTPATLQTLPITNGIATICQSTAPSKLFRPLNICFPKFEEKNDWLKQNPQPEWNYPIRWTGKLCLKNEEVFVQMHMLAGNEDLIRNSMNLISAGQDSVQPLRIVQRMRLEPNQLEGLQRRLSRPIEFCTCLTLAGGDKSDELARTSSTLHNNFIRYLQEKSAAGIINISIADSQQNAFVIHIFPPCEFSDNQLKSCSTKLYEKLKENSVPYLVIVITTI